MKLVGQAHIVMAGYIVYDHLRRISVWEFGILPFGIIHLRMVRCSYDADFHSLLIAGLTCGESTVGGISVMTLNGIAEIIGENGYILHLRYVLLQSSSLYCQWGITGSPTLAIYEDGGVNFLQLFSHLVHSLRVMNRH